MLTKFRDGREERELRMHKRKKNAHRQCFLVVGYSRVWTTPCHAILNRLRCKYRFKWLRLSMAYTCHSNLASLINADTGSKVMAGIVDEGSRDRPCKCGTGFKKDGEYIFGGQCRESCLVYKLTCRFSNMYYIGKTQRQLKIRIWDHVRATWKAVEERKVEVNDNAKSSYSYSNGSNAFARHFSVYCLSLNSYRETKKFVRQNTTIEILWKGNPISCLKNVITTRCGLCMKERRAILTAWRGDKPNLLNAKNEIFGACLCKSRFCQFKEE